MLLVLSLAARDSSHTTSSVALALNADHVSTAWWHDGIMELWAPTQSPQRAQTMVADLVDLDDDEVTVHQMRAGGGFGRRAINDVVAEAVVIAKRFDRPVKLTWKREDDMNFDFFRAGGFHSLTGAVDADGKISAWRNHHISLTHGGGRAVSGGGIRASIDPGPFIDNYRITQTLLARRPKPPPARI